MDFPESLDEWTYATVAGIVERYEYEPGFFDYKAVLNAPQGKLRDEMNRSIRKTAGAMANTGGGYIVFGVEDRAVAVATPLDRIKGVPLDGDLRKQFGDKLKEIQPPIHFETSAAPIPLPDDANRGIFVVSIPESIRRPHMVNPEGVFYRRDAGGSAATMDYFQVRDLLLLTESGRRSIPLLQFEITLVRVILDAILRVYRKRMSHYAFGRFSVNGLQVLLTDPTNLPLDPAVLDDLFSLLALCTYSNNYLDQLNGLPWQHRLFPMLQGRTIRDHYGTMLAALDTTCTRCERALARHAASLTAYSAERLAAETQRA